LRTEKPTFRITRWLRTSKTPGGEIPLEAECTACKDAQFIIKHDVRERYHAPDRESNLARLQSQFDAHVNAVHTRKSQD
jgi:hypothetical protein